LFVNAFYAFSYTSHRIPRQKNQFQKKKNNRLIVYYLNFLHNFNFLILSSCCTSFWYI